MRNYQLVLVLKAGESGANRKKIIDSVKDYIRGAKFDKDQELGEKELAYPIKKQKTGAYYNFMFEAEDLPSDLDKKLNSNEDILRYLVLRV